MGLAKVPKLNIGHEGHIATAGHTGKDITIFPDGYTQEDKKAEILNTLRHELEHYKQHLIVFLKKGDIAEQEAFGKQMNRRINVQAAMKDAEPNIAINEQIIEECHKYGFHNVQSVVQGEGGAVDIHSNGTLIPFSDVIKAAYEHDTPIQTIRSITPCEWEKMHFSPEELAKADRYLEGIRNYSALAWLPERFFRDGVNINSEAVRENAVAANLMLQIGHEGYLENIIEQEAIHAGESLRDKFRLFLDALN